MGRCVSQQAGPKDFNQLVNYLLSNLKCQPSSQTTGIKTSKISIMDAASVVSQQSDGLDENKHFS